MIKASLILFLALWLTAISACQIKQAYTPEPPSNNSENKTAANTASTTGEQRVVVDSPDGVKLVGTFYAADKPNSPAVLLLHQWQSNRHSYDDFAKRMQSKGFGVLSMDGRGFGESTIAADGTTVPPERTDAAVKTMLADVGAAFDFLCKQKNVDPSQVGIVGASYGSSLALIFAADNSKVKAVALLSPGLNYFGNMQTEPAIKKYGERPICLVASDDDKESASAVRRLKAGGGSNIYNMNDIFKKGGHGTALFDVAGDWESPSGRALYDVLEAFFVKALGT